MFQKSFVNEDIRPLPLAAGLGVVTVFVAALCVLPLLATPAKRLTPPTAVKLVTRLKPGKTLASVAKRDTTGGEPRLESPQPAAGATAHPGTPEWFAHVARGRGLSFDILAVASLPVLRAHGITLAMDVARPRGKTYLYQLGTRTFVYDFVPPDVIVRELTELPPSPDIEEARRRAERELGQKARIFALYPRDLYDALKSYTEDAMHHAAISPEAVSTARVQLQLVGGTTFLVTLVGHS